MCTCTTVNGFIKSKSKITKFSSLHFFLYFEQEIDGKVPNCSHSLITEYLQ